MGAIGNIAKVHADVTTDVHSKRAEMGALRTIAEVLHMESIAIGHC